MKFDKLENKKLISPCKWYGCSCRYNVPRSFLNPKGNLLVLFEEENGNPLGISVDTVSITRVCGRVTSSYPPPVISWVGQNQTRSKHKKKHGRRPKVQLRCPQRRKISKILFASFGTSFGGDCENYGFGRCHSSNSRTIVEKVSFFFFDFYFPINIDSCSNVQIGCQELIKILHVFHCAIF